MPQSLKIDEPAKIIIIITAVSLRLRSKLCIFKLCPLSMSLLSSHFCHLSYSTMAYVTLSHIGLTPAKKKQNFPAEFFRIFRPGQGTILNLS